MNSAIRRSRKRGGAGGKHKKPWHASIPGASLSRATALHCRVPGVVTCPYRAAFLLGTVGKSAVNKDLIKMRQRWVKDHPCRVVEECGLPGYVHDVEQGGLIIRTVLSIDLFTEPLAWRVQMALLYPSRMPRPRASWSIQQNAYLLGMARQLLDGVGCGADRLSVDSISFELARPVTAEEAEYVYRAAGRPDCRIKQLPVGEISSYDFTNRSLQVDGWWNGKTGREEGLFLPETRTLIYEPGSNTSN